MSEPETSLDVDYLFVGAGASSRLLLMSLDRHNLLKGKRVVVIDPDVKSSNDKTYCFWASPEELKEIQCESLIGHRWRHVTVDHKQSESLNAMEYMHISSIDLYHASDQIMKANEVKYLQDKVEKIESFEKGIKVVTSAKHFLTNTVFDSRPPKYLPPKINEAHLIQSFIGYVIQCDKPIERAEAIHLMDFEVDQLGCTQFVYVLPFSETKILVELTRFGENKITASEAEPILRKYISERFGKYEIEATETGCIPMCSSPIAKDAPLKGLISIGGRAGAIKPSTGYAFKTMAHHAEGIAKDIANNRSTRIIKHSTRFKLYDRLLLFILKSYPYLGKPIFQTLFKKNKTQTIFNFLDEKSTLTQEVAIFLSLPLTPFLKALWLDCTIRFEKTIAPAALLLLASVLWSMQSILPSSFEWIQYAVLAVGLFSVGIPHGAVDHLLHQSKANTNHKIKFVIQYLTAFAALLLVWLVSPTIALVLFLVYSAGHFGETDMQEWQIPDGRHVKAFLWGALTLTTILFGHTLETNYILQNMNVGIMPWNEGIGNTIAILCVAASLIWGWYEQRVQMILLALVLIISIYLPLLTSFGLYFLGHHSVSGWLHLKHGLKTNHVHLFRKALPFTLGAFALLLAMIILFQKESMEQFHGEWLSILFVFISCLSFPHVIAMHHYYLKVEKEALIEPYRKNNIEYYNENKT
jgi:lycopene beta-cyclase